MRHIQNSRRTSMKLIAMILVSAFTLQQTAYCAPDIKPGEWSIIRPALYNFKLAPYVASIEDEFISPTHKADPGSKTVFLVQDPHTNISGQLNIARSLETIIRKENLSYVFMEAGDGDASLSYIREGAPLEKRRRVASSLLNKGQLNGPEYLDLTSEVPFTLWGVEDRGLYTQSLGVYGEIVRIRADFMAYLNKVLRTVKVVKQQLLNPKLAAFDDRRNAYLKGEISITDYITALTRAAESAGFSLRDFPGVMQFKRIQKMESGIDFPKASAEQAEFFAGLSSDNRKRWAERFQELRHEPARLGYMEPSSTNAFYGLLEEDLRASAAASDRKYAELKKYFEYLKEARKLHARLLLDEQRLLENGIYRALSINPDEEALIAVTEYVRILEDLINLKIGPEQFSRFLRDPDGFDLKLMTGFLNKKIMDLGQYHEFVLFLDGEHEGYIQSAVRFYNLTLDRDKKFVDNMIRKMDTEHQTKSILIAGGYHTPNLKRLLKDRGISYVAVTPQVLHETDHVRYERMLLNQGFAEDSAVFAGRQPWKSDGTRDAIAMVLAAQRADPEGTPFLGYIHDGLGANFAARVATEKTKTGSRLIDRVSEWFRATFKKHAGRRAPKKRFALEPLENRALLSANPMAIESSEVPDDVQSNEPAPIIAPAGESDVSLLSPKVVYYPIDVLRVTNELNRSGSGPILPGQAHLDSNNDGNLSPIDALIPINFLNRGGIEAAVLTQVTETQDNGQEYVISADENQISLKSTNQRTGSESIYTLNVNEGTFVQRFKSGISGTVTEDVITNPVELNLFVGLVEAVTRRVLEEGPVNTAEEEEFLERTLQRLQDIRGDAFTLSDFTYTEVVGGGLHLDEAIIGSLFGETIEVRSTVFPLGTPPVHGGLTTVTIVGLADNSLTLSAQELVNGNVVTTQEEIRGDVDPVRYGQVIDLNFETLRRLHDGGYDVLQNETKRLQAETLLGLLAADSDSAMFTSIEDLALGQVLAEGIDEAGEASLTGSRIIRALKHFIAALVLAVSIPNANAELALYDLHGDGQNRTIRIVEQRGHVTVTPSQLPARVLNPFELSRSEILDLGQSGRSVIKKDSIDVEIQAQIRRLLAGYRAEAKSGIQAMPREVRLSAPRLDVVVDVRQVFGELSGDDFKEQIADMALQIHPYLRSGEDRVILTHMSGLSADQVEFVHSLTDGRYFFSGDDVPERRDAVTAHIGQSGDLRQDGRLHFYMPKARVGHRLDWAAGAAASQETAFYWRHAFDDTQGLIDFTDENKMMESLPAGFLERFGRRIGQNVTASQYTQGVGGQSSLYYRQLGLSIISKVLESTLGIMLRALHQLARSA